MKKKKIQKKPIQKVRRPFIIALIVAITVVIATIEYMWIQSANENQSMMQNTTGMQNNSGFPVDTSLTFQKGTGSVAVMIDTGENNISGVQLSISYDPKILSNVRISQGTLFTDPIELQNMVNQNAGSIDYTIAMKPNGQPIKGSGTVATISYTDISGKPTRITVNPLTKVTALGANISVLKSFESVTVQ